MTFKTIIAKNTIGNWAKFFSVKGLVFLNYFVCGRNSCFLFNQDSY